MQIFETFAQEYGSYTFKSKGEIRSLSNPAPKDEEGNFLPETLEERRARLLLPTFMRTVFVVTSAGNLELRVIKGNQSTGSRSSTVTVLEEEDFEDSTVLDALIAEIEQEVGRREALKATVQTATEQKKAIEDVIAQEKVTTDMEGALI